jgi:hypothetical protein
VRTTVSFAFRTANAGAADSVRWYCKSGKHAEPTILRHVDFIVTDLFTQCVPSLSNSSALIVTLAGCAPKSSCAICATLR